ncbi:MAG: hypothetical protein ACO3JL_21815, partial [Myxococcota bacterium]
YTLYDVATSSFTLISAGAGVNYVGNIDYGLSLAGNQVVFCYWGQTGGSGTSSAYDVYLWREGTSERVTSDNLRNIYCQSDGERIAWQSSVLGGTGDGSFDLKTVSLDTMVSSTVSTTATSFKLVDGVLAWVESSSTARALKASSLSGGVVAVSTRSTATLHAVGEGAVAFTEDGKLYTWDSTTGLRTLRLEAVPSQVWLSEGSLVFVLGTSVYRVGI